MEKTYVYNSVGRRGGVRSIRMLRIHNRFLVCGLGISLESDSSLCARLFGRRRRPGLGKGGSLETWAVAEAHAVEVFGHVKICLLCHFWLFVGSSKICHCVTRLGHYLVILWSFRGVAME